MAETSAFWDGTVTGDAVTAPYDAPTEFAAVLRSLGGGAGITTHLSGVYRHELEELLVAGVTSPLFVGSGRALVYGNWYQNDAATVQAVATPGAATRIDRLVLRKDWSAQTVRIALVAGVEGGSAAALTQNAGTTWDMPLAQVSITTGGAITVTDERNFLPLVNHVFAFKAANEVVNNSAVLQNDDDLFWQIGANEVWVARYHLVIDSLAAADFKAALTAPAGTTLLLSGVGLSSGAPGAGTQGETAVVGTAIVMLNDFTGSGSVVLDALIATAGTAGTVRLQWAQNTANVNDTTVFALSHVVAHRMN